MPFMPRLCRTLRINGRSLCDLLQKRDRVQAEVTLLASSIQIASNSANNDVQAIVLMEMALSDTLVI